MQALTILEPTQLADIDTGIAEIASALRQSAVSFLAAGKAYAALLDGNSRSVVEGRIKEKIPSLTLTTLRRLEAVGRGVCDERLLLSFSAGGRELTRVPVFEQKRALDNGIEFLAPDGSIATLSVESMNPAQVKQAIAFDHVRTIDEQRAYAVSGVSAEQEERKPAKAYVKDGKLCVFRKCKLSRYELATFMAQMG